MGYRGKVTLVMKDGRVKEYSDVYIKARETGFVISKYSDYSSSEEFIPYSQLDRSACEKANPGGGCFISTAVYAAYKDQRTRYVT